MDVKIIALVDWEQAGWHPEFSETERFRFGLIQKSEWAQMGGEEIFFGYDEEIALVVQLLMLSRPPKWFDFLFDASSILIYIQLSLDAALFPISSKITSSSPSTQGLHCLTWFSLKVVSNPLLAIVVVCGWVKADRTCDRMASMHSPNLSSSSSMI